QQPLVTLLGYTWTVLQVRSILVLRLRPELSTGPDSLQRTKAFQIVTTEPPAGSAGSVLVAFTILGPNPTVTISTNTLLANVAFELINSSGNSQTFSISNVIFVDNIGAQLTGMYVGSHAVESVAPNPHRQEFTAGGDPCRGPR